ncbi:T6SS phospholipase effector Tle1-like catalytic domain-containing protein, partial [Aspergillus brunneoviolaceus CBS 621.78]
METKNEPSTTRSQFVLCFDGTGNTFRADGTETNILRICRMLQRGDDQRRKPNPRKAGIGTTITPSALAATQLHKTLTQGKSKTLSQALGHTFDQHVLGGYRFLMRHYRTATDIYIFGFSRGAYTALFLAEMLDAAGLLGPDNEEMIPLVWEAFSQLKLTRYQTAEAQERAATYLRHCRETLCRPVRPARFLGLFDTVNSVAEFEVVNDGRSNARVVRHAVSIDERRVKFQPVLLGIYGRGERGQRAERVLDELWHGGVGGDDDDAQDFEEVWFPGNHADIGGGFQRGPRERTQISHVPLVWMVREAQRAGLRLDREKMKAMGCLEEELGVSSSSSSPFQAALVDSCTQGLLHSSLDAGDGVSRSTAWLWRFMEWIPIRRAAMQKDGRWALVHWPPHRGAPRDTPLDAKFHGSTIRRMKADSEYRPGNVIIGGSGMNCRRAPERFGIGEWGV